METPNLKKWAENHPPIISIFASWAAANGDIISKFLDFTKEKTIIFDYGSLPSSTKWLSLYNNKNLIRNRVIGSLKQFEGIPQLLGSSWEFITDNPDWAQTGITEFDKLEQEQKITTFNESKELVHEMQELFFLEISEDFEKQFDHDKLSLFEVPEIKFAYSVIIPSYVYYGVSPFKIFKKAQSGDLNAIEKIFRIDASALGDPLIFQHFHVASKKKKKEDFNRILNALQKPPKGKIDLQKIKFKIAGLISGIADQLNHRLTAPEIEKLFDCIAKDLNKPELKLIESEDIYNASITKHIKREKKFWADYLKWDKK